MKNFSQNLIDKCSPLAEAAERGETTLVSLARGQYPGKKLQKHQLPGLRSVGYWDAVGLQTWGLPMHYNEGIEICYLLSGETYFATETESWLLRPGDITITRPWQRHQLGNPAIKACKLFWMIIDIDVANERGVWEFPSWIGLDLESRHQLLKVFRKNQACHLKDENQYLKNFVSQICQDLESPDILAHSRIASLINYLLLSVAQRMSGDMVESSNDPLGFNHTIRAFFVSLESNELKAAEAWTVASMARNCRVGVTYFTAACKELFNTTPSEHLKHIRLIHAANHLKLEAKKPITEIAFQTGFSSSQYFATCFRKHFGSSPLEYRRTNS